MAPRTKATTEQADKAEPKPDEKNDHVDQIETEGDKHPGVNDVPGNDADPSKEEPEKVDQADLAGHAGTLKQWEESEEGKKFLKDAKDSEKE